MAWAASAIFRPFLTDVLGNVTAMDLSGASVDTFKAALYNTTTTPDNDVASAASAYNTGVWVVGNEVTEAGQWAAGGVALTSPAISNPAADIVMFDAVDTASGSAADLAAVFGTLIYDDTIASPVADQGVSYNYFGGSNSVVNGTFTVVYHANGIFRITL
jgi:hypothetical protein